MRPCQQPLAQTPALLRPCDHPLTPINSMHPVADKDCCPVFLCCHPCLPLQVDEVKGIMLQNVEQVLVRGERLDVLVDRADDLRDQVTL